MSEGPEELRYQRAIAACARVLLGGDAAERLGDALDALLLASEATSLFVSRNFQDPDMGLSCRLIHEAIRPGYVVDNEGWQVVPWSRLPESGAALASGEPFVFRVDDFTSAEKQAREGSTVTGGAQYPIFMGDEWAGLVGFVDHVRDEPFWTHHELRLLAAAAEMFAHLWEREQQQAHVRKRLGYEHALAECSAALLRGSTDDALDEVLDVLVQVTGARFAIVATNVDDPELGACSQALRRVEVAHPGGPPIRGFDEYWYRVPWSRQPEAYHRLAAGKPFAYRVDQLGPEERALYEASPAPTGSAAMVPIVIDGDWRGSVAYGYGDAVRDFEDEDLILFQTAADMIGAFWLRQEARAGLEAQIASKDEFLAAVSHELRTPLTSVVGLAEELRDRGEDFSGADRQEFSGLIAEQGMEMAYLVDDLLVAARIDAGAIDLDMAPIDVEGEVTRVVAEMRSAIAIEARLACKASADPLRFRQVLRNLITNALRYGGPGVRVECGRRDDLILVAVSDDGPAIEASARERIFEPYQRAHEEPSQPASVGLGLTVSRRLARLMGGDLCYVREGRRNVFELTLPVAGG